MRRVPLWLANIFLLCHCYSLFDSSLLCHSESFWEAIQCFGRVHRANQLIPPKFLVLTTSWAHGSTLLVIHVMSNASSQLGCAQFAMTRPLGGEVRFNSAIARCLLHAIYPCLSRRECRMCKNLNQVTSDHKLVMPTCAN